MAEEKKTDGMSSFEKPSESPNAHTADNSQKKNYREDNSRQTDHFTEDNRPHVPSRSTGLCALASLLLILASIFLIRFETNRVGSYTVKEGSYVTGAQIMEIVGNPEGKYLPALDTAQMEKEIKALSPMVADVTFDLSFTRRLTIRVTDEKPRYSLRCENGAVLLLNADFKALSYHPSDSCKKNDCDYEKGKLTDLYIRTSEEIVLGERLPFENADELSAFIRALNGKKGKFFEKLNLVDIRSARHIVFIFDDLVCVELSETKEFDIKCLALEKMMAKRKTREEEIETRFTYVDPVNGSIDWAVEEWANLYEDYPNHR